MRLIFATVLFLSVGANLFAQDRVDFNRDIKPILSDKCYTCHGPDAGQRQGGGTDGLRFDTKEGAFADLDGHYAIVAGDLEASELIRRVNSDDESEVMPPTDSLRSLTENEKTLLATWVSQEAKWEQHWAYVAPKSGQRVGRNWIDAMVQAKLSGRGFSQSPTAKKHTLVRRAYFDVIGLPPSRKQVEAFTNSTADDPWEELVDQLLSSPHFGERLAIYWLDLVRYADTVGYHGDQDVSVSPYRDYVIDAFNSNMPFDQFTREQLAGDLLPEPTRDQLVASGYNKLGMMSAEGGAQPKEYLAKYASDRVRTASTVWLGSTLGCAECHDHKFGPFTQKDFYQFASFFADIKERGLYAGASRDGKWGPTVSVPDVDLAELLKPTDAALAKLQTQYDESDVSASQLKWQASLAAKRDKWKVLQPKNPQSAFGVTLTTLDDNSVLASGPLADMDVYSFRATLPEKQTRGLRLELLPDDSLPHKGPGRAGNGNFVLSEVRVSVLDQAGNGRPVTFKTAVASHEQDDGKNNAYKGWKAAATIDGDVKGSKWGWAILPNIGKRSELVLEFKKPIKNAAELVIRLDQNHDNPKHTIGRFRVSATSGPVELGPLQDVPENIQELVFGTSLSQDQSERLANYYKTIAPELAGLRKKIADTKKKRDETQKAHTRTSLITQAVEPREMRVLPRGNWMDTSGPVVKPGVPHFLPQLQIDGDRRATRLDLAQWMTSEQNPLTARVFVNRLWKLFFGTGLSKVLDDIGSQGEFPTHPALLDELAIDFMQNNWNVKRLVKQMLMTQTYRQSSLMRDELRERDPYNRLLARQSRFRLDAELVRDNALAVSGLLVREFGGRSAKPYQPAGLLRHLNFPKRTYRQDDDKNQYRRGVYTHWQRQFLHPAMKSFDAPAREECTAERPRSNTPLAALVLLNDPSYVEAARVFAQKLLLQSETSDADKIEAAFHDALNRAPTAAESDVLLKLLASQRTKYMKNPEAAKQVVSTGLSPVSGKLQHAELAAMTSVTRAIFNLHEFITRN